MDDDLVGELERLRRRVGELEERLARTTLSGASAVDHRVSRVVDATEQSSLEEQLQQAQRMAALGRLAGGVAHDFNNLLTIIMMNVEMLLGESPRDELQQIMAAASHASDLTRRLLSFGRCKSAEPVALDVNDVIEGAVRLISRVMGDSIETSLELSRPLGKIQADSSQLHQVLLNLAVNARDAMANGGKLLIRTSSAVLSEAFVRARGGGGKGDFTLIEVKDTGIGMDEYTLSRMFEPFFTTKTPDKGTGLGLSTVFSVVRHSGGVMDVVSALGDGTTFRLYFPVISGAPEIAENGKHDAPT